MRTYSDKLKDPRWQRKRLEIMERDGWKCRNCGDEKSTLHVHHWAYNGDPWEVDPMFLSTYCHRCHAMAETLIAAVRPFGSVGQAMEIACMTSMNMGTLHPFAMVSRCERMVALMFTEDESTASDRTEALEIFKRCADGIIKERESKQ